MGDPIRADWRTVRRRGLRARPVAFASSAGVCPHGRAAEPAEPIVLLGSQVVLEPDGSKHVDLTGAEWHPQQCLAVPASPDEAGDA